MTRRGFLVSSALAACASPLAAKKKKKKKGQEILGLLAGTVFDPDGRSAPGVEVVAYAVADDSIKLEAVTNYRGEFSLRAPAAEDHAAATAYRVVARTKGFAPVEKTADVYRAQKTNINLLLEKAP